MMIDYPVARLHAGREYAIVQGHPWLFSGAFQLVPAALPVGAVADVVADDGTWIARGHLNVRNSLAFRVLTHDPGEAIDEAFYRQRIERAAALRTLLPADVTGYRLVHAEADGLPGIIVDRYDRWLVAQLSTAGAERQRNMILDALADAINPDGILVRDDIRVRAREGLKVAGTTVAFGTVPERIEIREGPARFLVDAYGGQKTGFFLDQREKRAFLAALAPHYASLLNCFAYTGGFAVAALARNGALHTVNVETSLPALELARENYLLNGFDPAAHEFASADVTRYLNAAADRGERADIVVLDPPAFAKSAAAKERALRAYETLNLHAARVVAPGGLLLTCSCSGAVTYAEFEGAVRAALVRTNRVAQVLAIFGPSLDHPTLPGFPEDRYLKALLLRLQ